MTQSNLQNVRQCVAYIKNILKYDNQMFNRV